MITIDELKELIEIEKKGRLCEHYDHTCLGYEFIEPNEEIEKLSQKKFNTNYASNFLLESYCGTTFRYVNDHLRRTYGSPCDEFVNRYQLLLNKLLDGIESYDNNIAWRWVNCLEGFNYLKSQVGKIIQIPEFKSTSMKKLPERNYWRIKTDDKSNGKMIYKHINKKKGEEEKEILFKNNCAFLIESVDQNCINLKEVKDKKTDFILCDNYWLKWSLSKILCN